MANNFRRQEDEDVQLQQLNVQSSGSPFSIQVLGGDRDNVHPFTLTEHLLFLMPASYRTESDDLEVPSLDFASINGELDLRRLNRVNGWLWIAGRPIPPRSLHYQLLLSREIFVTERLDMHLVWTTGRIFLKPIPSFLLDPHFWRECLTCKDGCRCSEDNEEEARLRADKKDHGHKRLWKCAFGFLLSYAALISHESDFSIAKEKHLIPAELEWLAWKRLVRQILEPEPGTGSIYHKVDGRFTYGELRLSRLNKIYRLSQRPILRAYVSHWQQYGSFFRDNFAWLASATVYIAVVLTAMQVGLATKSLADNDSFQSASYGFTVFSIIGPLCAAGIIFLVFIYMFVNNTLATINYRKKRLYKMGLKPDGSKAKEVG